MVTYIGNASSSDFGKRNTVFRRLVVLPSSGEITERTLLGARHCNSLYLRRTAGRNIVFFFDRNVQLFQCASLVKHLCYELSDVTPLIFICEVCVKLSE